MTKNLQGFKAAEIGNNFKIACARFDNLLASAESKELIAIRQRLHSNLQEYKQIGAMSVAFIGQYSAGKSTIISALTGQRDIHIDADIATDKTSTYDWNGIKIIDTPGLFTDRQDHDKITYDAIDKSDLLIFCLTHMLFDKLTVENFKKLAYEKGYRWKMMLVINKMSSGAGEDDQKISNYRHSLIEALKPYQLDDFPVSFIDAKDYCDGIDEQDDFFITMSRFDIFINSLNYFVDNRSALTRFDTPIRIVLNCIDEAQVSFTRNSGEDSAFLEVLNRLKNRINKERERLRSKVRGITLNMSGEICNLGNDLASELGESNFEDLSRKSELKVRKCYEKSGETLERSIEDAVTSIRSEVELELTSDLTTSFVSQLSFDPQFSVKNSAFSSDTQQLMAQIDWLKKIGEQVGVRLVNSATRDMARTAGSTFFRSMDVAGSSLHQTVYSVGKFIGFQFKPWQAVGIAKNIGNFAKILGPVMALVSVGASLYSLHQEREREQQIADARRSITSEFQSISKDLEEQVNAQLRGVESEIYGEIENRINQARNQVETGIKTSKSELGQLSEIRKSLEILLQKIQREATTVKV